MGVQAGVWSFHGEPANADFLARVSGLVAEYGPDGEAKYLKGPIGMLYRSFHTTRESRLACQPYGSLNEKLMTWDGRLDNRDELIHQLSGDLTADRSDVAIVMAAFERWGTDCFAKLIGDWALVVWDPREDELIFARDYIGIKQLFYYPKRGRVIWCSHMAPLIQSGDQFTLCDEYIAGYFGLWPEAHLTPLREIHSVPPGRFVCICNGQVRIRSYWTFNPQAKTQYKTDAEYEEHFRHLFRQSVRRRLRTDSPVLAELSGGLDSSSIVCVADDILAEEGSETPCIDTFSYYDLSEPDEEDFLYFTKVEERRGRIGHHAELRGVGNTLSFGYPTFVATPGFGLREELKDARFNILRRGNYRVLLSGIGGDEMTGQALDPRVQLADLLANLRLRTLLTQLIGWSLYARRAWPQLLFDTFILFLPTPLRTRMKSITKVEPWLNKRFARRHGVTDRLLAAGQGSWYWLPGVRHYFQRLRELSGQLTNVFPCVEETRYPFLDQTLIEFLTSIPTDQLTRSGQRRSLMRRALANILPREILMRRTKASSGRCDIITLEKHWHKLESALDSSLASRLGYLDGARFRSALTAMKNGRVPPWVVELLRGVSLEFWLRDAVARGVISVPTSFSRDDRPDGTQSSISHAPRVSKDL